MNDLLPFVVSGIAIGSIFGLAATGLVLTYKTSGIFNFGHGAIATAAAYVFYWLHIDQGVDWKPALVLAVFVVGPVLGLGMEAVARRLSQQRPAWKIVGTVGLILVMQGLGAWKYGEDTIRVRQYLPKPFESFQVAGVNVLYPQLWVTLVGVVVVTALYILFRFTRSGIAMRAVVDDPGLVAMQGLSPNRIRRVSWIIGCTLAALSGVLVLPFIGLNGIALTFLVVQAFGAAAAGGFSSIPGTFAGALAIGVASDLSKKYILDVSWLSGLPDSIPFVVLFIALLVLPKRKLVTTTANDARPRLQWRGPAELRAGVGVLVLLVLALVPVLVPATKLPFFTVALTLMISVLSLGLLVRTAGLVSLCHAAFAAMGAVAFSQLTVDHGMPWLLAVFLAALIVVPVGAAVAIPAIRLSGLFLALATFGFGIMVERLLYARNIMFTPLSEGRAMPRPGFAQTDQPYYYVVLAFVVATAAIMMVISRARLGRVLRGMADAPVAVTTLGLSANTTRVIVFCVSSFFAAVGGILYGSTIHFATAADMHFQSFYSLILLAVLALSPFAEPWYAVFAGITAVIPGYLTDAQTPNVLNVVFGVAAVGVALQGGPLAMPHTWRRALDRFGRQRPSQQHVRRDLPALLPARTHGPTSGTGLEVEGLVVRFGGLLAVHDLTFCAPAGRITGLIGPNGAGKTTTFDACSGLNRRVGGVVRLNGEDVTRLPAAARGRRGLGRTFQRMQLGDSLTVAENVGLGAESMLAGAGSWSQLMATRLQSRQTEAAVDGALELCGIRDLARVQAGALSTGQRRLVELARCLAGPFGTLLLDEPSSGLDRAETAAFDAVLQRVVAERGCGILLVEHDMSLVMNVCSYLYVLDFGQLIFEGEPADVAASPIVQAAYLGSESIVQRREQRQAQDAAR